MSDPSSADDPVTPPDQDSREGRRTRAKSREAEAKNRAATQVRDDVADDMLAEAKRNLFAAIAAVPDVLGVPVPLTGNVPPMLDAYAVALSAWATTVGATMSDSLPRVGEEDTVGAFAIAALEAARRSGGSTTYLAEWHADDQETYAAILRRLVRTVDALPGVIRQSPNQTAQRDDNAPPTPDDLKAPPHCQSARLPTAPSRPSTFRRLAAPPRSAGRSARRHGLPARQRPTHS
jgi:hypothetical protein